MPLPGWRMSSKTLMLALLARSTCLVPMLFCQICLSTSSSGTVRVNAPCCLPLPSIGPEEQEQASSILAWCPWKKSATAFSVSSTISETSSQSWGSNVRNSLHLPLPLQRTTKAKKQVSEITLGLRPKLAPQPPFWRWMSTHISLASASTASSEFHGYTQLQTALLTTPANFYCRSTSLQSNREIWLAYLKTGLLISCSKDCLREKGHWHHTSALEIAALGSEGSKVKDPSLLRL